MFTDAENQFAQPRSPLVDLDEHVEEEHSFEGALDLRPPRAESDVAGATGASAAAAMPVFQFERPVRFTRKGPHRLDDDLVSKMAEACVKNRPSAALAPEEVIAAAFTVIDHQEELEYAELRAATGGALAAKPPTAVEDRLRFQAKARNFDAMLDRLLRIYVLVCMRAKDAEGFAAAEKAREEAVRDANGRRRLPIHMGIADGMYEAMINNEWAAFDNMHLLPETGNRA